MIWYRAEPQADIRLIVMTSVFCFDVKHSSQTRKNIYKKIKLTFLFNFLSFLPQTQPGHSLDKRPYIENCQDCSHVWDYN